jgi:hypothetical protein
MHPKRQMRGIETSVRASGPVRNFLYMAAYYVALREDALGPPS